MCIGITFSNAACRTRHVLSTPLPPRDSDDDGDDDDDDGDDDDDDDDDNDDDDDRNYGK